MGTDIGLGVGAWDGTEIGLSGAMEETAGEGCWEGTEMDILRAA